MLTPLFALLLYYVKFDHLRGAAELAFVMAAFHGGLLAGGLLMSVKKGFRKKIAAMASAAYIIFAGYAIVALTPLGLFWSMGIMAEEERPTTRVWS